MRLALECRTDMLEMVQPFADFDWILGHKVLEDEEYTKYYSRVSTKVKFIDNSVNEVGTPLTTDQLGEVRDKVRGGLIVSPDWIGDAEKTLEAYEACVKVFGRDDVVGVLQGNTFGEALACLKVYGSLIAVPYDITSSKEDSPQLMGLRRALLVSNLPNDRSVHLLGYTSLDELWWYSNRPWITSIDTGIPILLGLQGLDILEPLESKAEPTLNQIEKFKLGQKEWTAVIRNIALLRRYLP